MADTGIRSPNLPAAPLIEVLGHSDAGNGRRTTARMGLDNLASALLGTGPFDTALDALRTAISSGSVVFQTVAEANAHLSYAPYTPAQVVADPGGAAVNGIYQKQGGSGAGSWLRIADLSILISGLDAAYRSAVKYLEPVGALYQDNGSLLIPPMRYYGQGTPTLYAPPKADGFERGFWEVFVPTYPYQGAQIVYLNTATGDIVAGSPTADPFFADVGSAAKPIIAILYAGAIHTPFQIARNCPNQYAFALNGHAPITGSTTRMRFTSQAALNGLGIYRTYIASDGKPYVGGLIERPQLNQHAFVRLWLTTDFDITDVQGQILDPNNSAALKPTLFAGNPADQAFNTDTFVLERQWSARVVSLLNVTSQLRADRLTTTLAVGIMGGPPGANPEIAFQFATGAEPKIYVSRQDNPARQNEPAARARVADGSKPNRLIYGPRLALIEGRPQTFYTHSVVQDRDPLGGICSLSFRSPETMAAPPFVGRDREAITLDPARIANGAAGRLTLQRPRPYANQRQWVDLIARVVPLSGLSGKTLKVMFLGDSWTEGYPTWRYVREILKACGVTVQLVGTMFRGVGDGNEAREGRSGIAAIDLTYKRTAFASPVTDAAAYMAMSYTDQRAKNPFLFPSNAAGSYNGRRFDFSQYLAVPAYGLTAPDIVVIDLGTNDPQHATPQATPDAVVAMLTEAYGVIVPSIRAAGSKVLLVAHQQACGDGADEGWEDHRARGIIPAGLSCVSGLNDPGVQFCPAYAHTDPIAFGPYTQSGVDALTGAKTGAIADTVHPGQWEAATQQHAECVAAHIAAMIV